jgi:hypothetical protein
MTAAAVPFAALPLAFGGSVATAAQLLPTGAATVLHHGPTPWAMDDNLGGALCDEPKVCREVSYQWIVALGTVEIGLTPNVRALDFAIKNLPSEPDAPEDKIVYAFSGGARVASVWLRDHSSDHENSSATPPPEDLTFVLLGNGGRKYGGLNGWWYGDKLLTPTDTDYAVIDVAREYDPIADFPANPFNLLALANAVAAFTYVHMSYDEVDLDDPANIVWTEGNTTYVHVPTKNLPLLQGFRDFGLGWLVDGWEEPLRAIIDQAYDRTWLDGKLPQGEAGDETLQTLLDEQQETPRTVARTQAAGHHVDGEVGDEVADEVANEVADEQAPDPATGGEDTTDVDTTDEDTPDEETSDEETEDRDSAEPVTDDEDIDAPADEDTGTADEPSHEADSDAESGADKAADSADGGSEA